MRRLLAAFVAWMLVTGAAASEFAFALIGDVPYNRFERRWFADYLARIADDGVTFVLHVGDIKSGGEPCSDAVFDDRLALFDASPVPFVLVPGDNDWSDCNRLAAGRYDPLERLDALRARFFPAGSSLGRQRMAVASQADSMAASPYRENLMWHHGAASFVTLNVPGPSNRRGRGGRAPAEFVARNRANLAWLARGFAEAAARGSRVMVVAMQANPWIEDFVDGDPHPGYAELLTALRAHTEAFAGEVLLLHGDQHLLIIDQPMTGRDGSRLARFTRVQCFGSPLMGWVRIAVGDSGPTALAIDAHGYSPSPAGALQP